MNQFHERYDLLLTPTLPLAAFDAGRKWPTCSRRSGGRRTPFSTFNLTQQPAASIRAA
jgi:aspartyl-tRNA(Asn)/glutamyl-tRNA(Gln) amidotransferase subunit A